MAPDLADRIFPNRSGGFRGDVVCMTLCGAAFVVWSLFAIGRWFDDRNGKNKVDAALGGVWMLEYFFYLRHLLNHLWMG